MHRFVLIASILASSASASTFEFAPSRPDLIPVAWNFREVATRTVLGCRQWDVLQGSGWFQATWYTDYTPALQGLVYQVTPAQKLPAKLCAAKMDQYNSVRMEMNSDLVDSGKLRGSFSINPDGLQSDVTITCHHDPEGNEYTNLACEEAHVYVPSKGTVRINIQFVD